jgi:hypothetical protein
LAIFRKGLLAQGKRSMEKGERPEIKSGQMMNNSGKTSGNGEIMVNIFRHIQ